MQESKNGWYLSPHGTIRILLLFVEVEYDVNREKDPRGDRKIKPGDTVDVVIYANPRDRAVLERNLVLIAGLARATSHGVPVLPRYFVGQLHGSWRLRGRGDPREGKRVSGGEQCTWHRPFRGG